MNKSQKLTLEIVLYSLAFLLALFLRLLNLGAAPLSDQEAGWALQALQIARPETAAASQGSGAQPAYVILTGLTFIFLGANDFLARFWPALAGALGRPALQRLAVRAAGSLQSQDAVPAILPLCASTDRILALDAMVALEQIGDERAYETASALLRSPSLPMRKAAIGLMAKFPARAIATLSSASDTVLRDPS